MIRLIAFAFGLAAYLLFFVTILYAIGFVSGFGVPKDIDAGALVSAPEALLVNLALLTLFAVQHSVMARKRFKRWLTQYVPVAVERSTYVMAASLVLLLLFWQWRPMPGVLWHTDNALALVLTGLSLAGWALVFASTFLINHFELFGLSQVVNHLSGRTASAPRFQTPLLYKLVRHPLYLGFLVAFWVAPTMTVGHALFAMVTTAYIFVGIALEEHELLDLFGDEYRRYRESVAMIVPPLFLKGRRQPRDGAKTSRERSA
ncbi:MAG: isoprenylcysteine carboxylmethyltransferase family protein [Reyranella sp.]|uniref:methanethiol S-methyltransferase n=1 Tax=Reyranella sp. TaxID=1929291 RepID=UPI00120AC51C|nr:methanethiol S-methyltransferase [Reyranella sp.]TAJ97479.1 MAG: isoprenylcysteine carboxylmethyltransferase family protein [Reyranella sp.]TBR30176.1 MAG: isoprenylcysteine carboxylmethyltransferase family protein [Reyranella sp.]